MVAVLVLGAAVAEGQEIPEQAAEDVAGSRAGALTSEPAGAEPAEAASEAFGEVEAEQPSSEAPPSDTGAADASEAPEAVEPSTDDAASEPPGTEPASDDSASDEPPVEDAAAAAPDADDSDASATDWSGLIERAPAFLALTHHAAVHLPIALWLFGAFFVVIGVVAPSLRNQIPLACLVGGAVTSVAATASGWWYAGYEWGEPWDCTVGVGDIDWSEQLTQHRWTGVALVAASCVLSVLAVISVNRQGWKLAWFWRLGLIALAAAVAWEGHIGGELIHGEGFLEEAFIEWVSPAAD